VGNTVGDASDYSMIREGSSWPKICVLAVVRDQFCSANNLHRVSHFLDTPLFQRIIV
jgi:hypothetical protein